MKSAINQSTLTPNPIFIGGLFKSGTTLLRKMIDQHPNIASGFETYWFDLDWTDKSSTVFGERVNWLRSFYSVPDEAMDQYLQAASAEAFVDQLLADFAKREGKDRWAEKTPGNILHLDRIYAAWPRARVIHIARDPRDVLASLREARKWDTIDEFMQRWTTYIGAAESAKANGIVDKKRFKEIAYEDLILDPEATMMDIVRNFLEEAWHPEVARFEGSQREFDQVFKATGKKSTTLERLRDPMTQSRIGIWRKVLDAEDIPLMRRAADSKGLLETMDRLQFSPRDGADR